MEGASSLAPSTDLREEVAALPLVDHHVHSTWAGPVDSVLATDLIRESGRPLGAGLDAFDSALGLAIRRHCAPLLGLEPHAAPGDYLARRAEHSAEDLSAIFLGATRVNTWLVDTGFRGDDLLKLETFTRVAPGRVHEIVRLESVLEDVASESTPATLAEDLRAALAEQNESAVGWKSVVAYRHGLEIEPARPTPDAVRAAASDWWGPEGFGPRVEHPVLLRFLLWEAVDTGKPIQLHTGFGDADLHLRDADPTLLTPWLREIEGQSGPIVLLHTYPFQRHAAYLAHVYPHVYLDVGLGMHYAAAGSESILREALEIAPFGKVLYSSDGWGMPELHFLGAHFWKQALIHLLEDRTQSDEWSSTDAIRVATLMASENARRIYGLRHG